MLTLAVIFKLLAEIALLVLIAQALVGMLSGHARERNPVYRLLQVLGRPWLKVARAVSPRVIVDAHVPWVAVFLLMLVWSVATVAKVTLCLQMGVALCR
ncbi:MAG: hypothetical protein JWQ72_2736 [Polaromonas sp.]|nr:hypothetical protein [Polaromonas sp.]